MEWHDDGLIIGLRKHGEASVIVELMTREHGRHMGVVKGGRSQKLRPILQQGNSVQAIWRARLEEHLGLYQLEETRLRAAGLMESGMALSGLSLMGDLLRLLPERDPHEALFEMASVLADHLSDRALAPQLMVRFELSVLSELGFGLDLNECAATGLRDDLCYVSPKSGRAVSRGAGEPWKDRLLPLPAFLTGEAHAAAPVGAEDVRAAFRLTAYFLEKDVFGPRQLGLPEGRARFLASAEV